MSLLPTLLPSAPSSAPLSSLSADLAGASAGRAHDPAVRAVERVQGLHDPLRERARQARLRQAQTGRSDERDRGPGGAGTRGIALRAPVSVSAPFLVQVFGQDLGRHQVFISEHRDAAIRGSEAYRRAGATPPVYSQETALFRVAV